MDANRDSARLGIVGRICFVKRGGEALIERLFLIVPHLEGAVSGTRRVYFHAKALPIRGHDVKHTDSTQSRYLCETLWFIEWKRNLALARLGHPRRTFYAGGDDILGGIVLQEMGPDEMDANAVVRGRSELFRILASTPRLDAIFSDEVVLSERDAFLGLGFEGNLHGLVRRLLLGRETSGLSTKPSGLSKGVAFRLHQDRLKTRDAFALVF